MKRGRFITFEGIEGSGKSTQARLLVARLRAMGRRVVTTREPGGTAPGEAIRAILKDTAMTLCPEAELLLFAASRAQLVREVIAPALKRGAVVVSDRFVDSTTVYQGLARGLGLDATEAVGRLAVGRAAPDLTILLDIEVRKGLARLRNRTKVTGAGLDRIEREGIRFHSMVRDEYLAVARGSRGRMKVIDGSRDQAAVSRAVWRIVSDVL